MPRCDGEGVYRGLPVSLSAQAMASTCAGVVSRQVVQFRVFGWRPELRVREAMDALIMAFYLCISVSASIWLNWYKARLQLKSAATEVPATREPSPSLPPPARTLGALEWVHRNLLSPWWNAVLTVAAIWLCYQAISGIYNWSVQDAALLGGREACEGIKGACWPFVADTWALFLIGAYPEDERWRPYLCFVLLFVLSVVSLAARGRRLGVGRLYAMWGAAPFVLVAILRGGGVARPDDRLHRPVRRTHADDTALHHRNRGCLSPRDATRARPAQPQDAGGEIPVRRLHRADPGCPSDLDTFFWRCSSCPCSCLIGSESMS